MKFNAKPSPEINFLSMPVWRGLTTSPKFTTAPFQLGCDESGYLRQTTPDHILEKVYAAYADPNYEFLTPPPGASEWGNQLGDWYFEEICEHLKSLDGARILEIGAGSTTLAKKIMQTFDVTSYSIVDPALTPDKRIKNLTTHKEFFPCPQISGEQFDFIISINTIEHIGEAKKFLRALREHLEPENGRLFLHFPETGSQFMEGDLNILIHEHINYFNMQSFINFAGICGLNVFTQDVKRNSILMSLGVADYCAVNPDILIECKESLSQIFYSFNRVVQEMGAFLRHISEDQSVIFHGATPGLNTFLFLTELAGGNNITITDGDVKKHRLFLPCHDSPVVEPSESLYRNASIIVISALSFFDPISANIRGLVGENVNLIPLSLSGLDARPEHISKREN